MGSLRCGVCNRTDYMDFPGYLGRTDAALGVQVCAYCDNGPKITIRLAMAKGRPRLLAGSISRRIVPEMSDAEYQLWCLEWLAGKLNDMANAMIRSAKPLAALEAQWHK